MKSFARFTEVLAVFLLLGVGWLIDSTVLHEPLMAWAKVWKIHSIMEWQSILRQDLIYQ